MSVIISEQSRGQGHAAIEGRGIAYLPCRITGPDSKAGLLPGVSRTSRNIFWKICATGDLRACTGNPFPLIVQEATGIAMAFF